MALTAGDAAWGIVLGVAVTVVLFLVVFEFIGNMDSEDSGLGGDLIAALVILGALLVMFRLRKYAHAGKRP
jgi:hypothetical protein